MGFAFYEHDRPRYRWRDEDGIVHRMEDDFTSEREEPYTLIPSCQVSDRIHNWNTHEHDLSHAQSKAIRQANLDAPLTCLACVAIAWQWEQNQLRRRGLAR